MSDERLPSVEEAIDDVLCSDNDAHKILGLAALRAAIEREKTIAWSNGWSVGYKRGCDDPEFLQDESPSPPKWTQHGTHADAVNGCVLCDELQIAATRKKADDGE